MEELKEKIYELLKNNAENVSANHWVNAIHEDKFFNLSEEIVKLFIQHVSISLPSGDDVVNVCIKQINDRIAGTKT